MSHPEEFRVKEGMSNSLEIDLLTKMEYNIFQFIKFHPNCTREMINEGPEILHCGKALARLRKKGLIKPEWIEWTKERQREQAKIASEEASMLPRTEKQLQILAKGRKISHELGRPKTEKQLKHLKIIHELPRTAKQREQYKRLGMQRKGVPLTKKQLKNLEDGRKLGRHISRYQRELYMFLKTKFEDAQLEYLIKTKYTTRFADIGVPSMRIDFEYDGRKWHKDKERDKQRDLELLEVGWITFRINVDILYRIRKDSLLIDEFEEYLKEIV